MLCWRCLIIHLQVVPRSIKRGSIHPLTHTSSGRSAELVKHGDNFTFTFHSFIHSFIHSSVAPQPFVGPGLFFSFVNFLFIQSVAPIGRGISPSQGRHLHNTQNKRTQTSMPWVGSEPTIPAFEWAKIVHALGRAASVIGLPLPYTPTYLRR
jgi:serine acetyltransferase